jgi:hypothetical protein
MAPATKRGGHPWRQFIGHAAGELRAGHVDLAHQMLGAIIGLEMRLAEKVLVSAMSAPASK